MADAQLETGDLFGSSNYGSNPISFNQFTLSEEVLDYLQQDSLFGAPDDTASFEALGFSKCVDYPDIPGHKYYEGYFHSLPQRNPVPAQHPRLGIIHDKPAAPLRVAAVCEAIRRKNTKWSEELQRRLEGLHTHASQTLAKVISHNRLFADLAIQVHYGDAIERSLSRYHVDAPNSLLHLAISVRGHRTLMWKACEHKSDNIDDYLPRGEPQEAGSVYLSCPAAFQHGVAYPECSSDNRTIAVQCRCLLTMEDLETYGAEVRHGFQGTIAELHNALKNGFYLRSNVTKLSTNISDPPDAEIVVFTLPSLEEVKEVEVELTAEERGKKRGRLCVIS